MGKGCSAALPVADTEVLGRTARCDATFNDVLYNLDPVDLFQSNTPVSFLRS